MAIFSNRSFFYEYRNPLHDPLLMILIAIIVYFLIVFCCSNNGIAYAQTNSNELVETIINSSSKQNDTKIMNLTAGPLLVRLYPNPPTIPTAEQENYVGETYFKTGVPESDESINGPSIGSETKFEDNNISNNRTIHIFRNQKLTISNSSSSLISEPSVANKGNIVLYVGNWYTARSDDGGVTWNYIDPGSDMRFCCDQDVIYDPNHQVFIWYRQARNFANAENSFRLGASYDSLWWWFYDVSPTTLKNSWRNQSFDYPHCPWQ
jgi:hypothetical protein